MIIIGHFIKKKNEYLVVKKTLLGGMSFKKKVSLKFLYLPQFLSLRFGWPLIFFHILASKEPGKEIGRNQNKMTEIMASLLLPVF